MKKIVLIALSASMFIATAEAQRKQAGGENNFQVRFAPFGQMPVDINGIAFRKFNATGDAAWRVNLDFKMKSSTDVHTQAIDTGTFLTNGGRPQGNLESSSMTIGIRPGFEKHFAGTENLSPYIGLEGYASMTTTSSDSDVIVDNRTTANPSGTDWLVLTNTRKGEGGYMSYGLNLVAGADYYVAKNIFMGVEFFFGLIMKCYSDIESSEVGFNTTSGSFVLEDQPKQVQGSSMMVRSRAESRIRLGWNF